MKILLIDNSSLTPIGNKLFCDLRTGVFAKELSDLGNNVTMYGQSVQKNNNNHSFDILSNNIKVYKLDRKKNKIINYILLYFYILPLVFKSDFVYIFYPSSFKYVAFICWFFRRPYGLYIRGQNDLKSKSSKFIYKRAFFIFTVADFFTNFVNRSNSNCNTVRPMISLSEKDIVSNRYYTRKNKYKILFLARMAKEKGVNELLQAIKILYKKGYDCKLELVGDGEYLPEARVIIEELGIEKIVTIRGAISDSNVIKKLYLDSDIYILPTYHEGFPRTLYEAMIFGTPIITTFVGGISGIMKHNYNCLEIKPKSVVSIVDNLIYAFNNYSMMEILAKNAVSTVKPIVDSSRPSHAQHLNILINKD